MTLQTNKVRAVMAMVVAALAVIPIAKGDDASTSEKQRLERLEQENKELRQRLDALEAKSAPASVPSTGVPGKTLEFLGQTSISGFVSASYFYDFSKPADGISDGVTWTANHNAFTLNKVKLALDNPVEASPDKWDAGYNVMLIFGQDSPIVNTFGAGVGADIRQAYVAFNVPVGNGLVVKAGQLISLLNFESGDGGVANPNFSQGNQWFFTGNGPSTGVQLGYAWSDKVSTTVRVQNRMFGAQDNNSGKTFMGNICFTPDDKTGLTFIGFGGPEGAGNNHDQLFGGSVIATRKLTDKLGAATEWDYFNAQNGSTHSAWWSGGAWLWYDFCEKFGVAGRVDYVNDEEGAGTSGLLSFAPNTGQELFSATLTLNIKPVAGLKIQPEIRYDHTSLNGAFDGQDDRVTAGVGVSYAF